MVRLSKISLALLLVTGGLAGCASQPVRYQGLASAAQLTANPKDKVGHVPFVYAASNTDWSQYSAFLLDPVLIYSGPDGQFGNVSDEDKRALASYIQEQFAGALKAKFAAATTPSANTLRIRVTLTGVEANVPILGTVSKVVPAGAVMNTVQTARDKQGLLSGSVSYAVEIYDSTSNRLLRAYISKQYPWAVNVFASFGPLDAARAGIRMGADDLVLQLGRSPS
ncbi:DUF3313 domain-containing protein [Pleomorphomonas oryzae]|uniref:DUF3313 domain-containing protein n=1 Tax=Pleomorphomonas oryzae TaxID=261934 RepID=UPI00056B8A24|nr:DUF3313 domain-containing protein [Pleomorphomonas oryzae]